MSLILSNDDGAWELSLACGELPVDSAIRAAGLEPNGYFWEAVATFVAPDVGDAFEYDSEADLFSAWAEDAAPLRRLMDLLAPLTANQSDIAAVIERAGEQGVDLDRTETSTDLHDDIRQWRDDRFSEEFVPADPAAQEAIGYFEVGRDGLGKLRERAESVRHLFVRLGCTDLSDLHEFANLEILEIHQSDYLKRLVVGKQSRLHTLKISPNGIVRGALRTAEFPSLTRIDLYDPPGELLQEALPIRPTEVNLYRPHGEGPVSLSGPWFSEVERLSVDGAVELDCTGIMNMRNLRWLILGPADRLRGIDALNQRGHPLEFVEFTECGKVDDRRALLALTADRILVRGEWRPAKRMHIEALPAHVRDRWTFEF